MPPSSRKRRRRSSKRKRKTLRVVLTWSVLVPVFFLLFYFASISPDSSSPDLPIEDRFDQLISDYLDYYWTQRPEEATRLGGEGFDHRLAPTSLSDVRDRIERLREFLYRTDSLLLEVLPPELLVDLRLLRSSIRVWIHEIEVLKLQEREPAQYIPFEAVNSLITQRKEFQEQAPRILSRLRQVPRMLFDGKRILKDPPRRFTETAISKAQKTIPFFDETLPSLAHEAPGSESELMEASHRAGEALREFLRFLQQDLLPRSGGSLRVGKESYDFLLRESHLLEEDSTSLLEKGLGYFADTSRLMEEAAREIDPNKSWKDLTEEIRFQHPGKEDLLDAPCDAIQRARRHVIAQELLTVPPDEEVRCISTPPSLREFSPFGTFQQPAPFSDQKIGYLKLNPIPDGLSPEEEEDRLRAHDHTWISVIAPHESYPGHHLQALKAQENPSLLRKLYRSPLFSEGWGLYSEELMYETGFFQRPKETRLTQLRLRLWRAARVILDVQLHTGLIDYDGARQFLIDEVSFDPQASLGGVNLYIFRPSYVISYAVGYFEIMKLREQYQDRLGERFKLRDFHDRLLTMGALPFSQVRELLAEQ